MNIGETDFVVNITQFSMFRLPCNSRVNHHRNWPWFLRRRLGVEALAGSKVSPTPSQKQRKTIGRGHAATSSLIPTRSSTAWVICGGSEGAAARGREGAEGRLSARSHEQRKGGRVALYLHEPWRRRCGGARATELRLLEGGRCGGTASACVKQGGDAWRSDACGSASAWRRCDARRCDACVKERFLRRDKDTLVGCLMVA